jgi:hypothetical protein
MCLDCRILSNSGAVFKRRVERIRPIIFELKSDQKVGFLVLFTLFAALQY